MRERMEEHRKNPTCNSCHRVIDPLGLRSRTTTRPGAWRIKDNEVAGRSRRRALRRHEDRRPGKPARGAAETQGRRRAQLHREPDDLRARPPRRVLTTCRRSAPIVRDAAKNDYRMSSFINGVIKSAAFQMGGRRPRTRRDSAARRTASDRTVARQAELSWAGLARPSEPGASMFISQEAHLPPNGPAGHGRHASRCRCSTPWCRRGRRSRRARRRQDPLAGCIEMVHGAAGSTEVRHREEHVVAGRDRAAAST